MGGRSAPASARYPNHTAVAGRPARRISRRRGGPRAASGSSLLTHARRHTPTTNDKEIDHAHAELPVHRHQANDSNAQSLVLSPGPRSVQRHGLDQQVRVVALAHRRRRHLPEDRLIEPVRLRAQEHRLPRSHEQEHGRTQDCQRSLDRQEEDGHSLDRAKDYRRALHGEEDNRRALHRPQGHGAQDQRRCSHSLHEPASQRQRQSVEREPLDGRAPPRRLTLPPTFGSVRDSDAACRGARGVLRARASRWSRIRPSLVRRVLEPREGRRVRIELSPRRGVAGLPGGGCRRTP